MTIAWVRKQDNAWQSSTGVTVLGMDKRTIPDCPQIQVSSGNGAPSYSSDTPSVVAIDPNTGEIKLQGQPGTATMTARLSNGETDSYSITVKEIEAVISFPDYLSSSASISVGAVLNLNPLATSKVAGTNAGTSFSYSASNSILTVSQTGRVTAGSRAGTATITVTLNSNQYAAAQATFVVQVQASVGDVVVVNATSNASVVTVSGGVKPTCQITAMMTINGKKPAGVSYRYSVTAASANIATIDANSGLLASGANPGIVEVTVTATVDANAAEYAGVAGSTVVAITVVAADGDTNDPRPASYPTYSGSQPPTIEAVKALLKALMASDADRADDTTTQNVDESNIVVAQQLFGLDYDYFAATAPNGKKVVFPINESNNIYQASSTATSHLRLKVNKELVLGDNISFSFTRGNTFSINVNLNDKADFAGQDTNHDGVDDSVQTGHGVTNTSITGIASALTLGANEVVADDLYQYAGSPGTGKNYIYLPRLKTLKLDYGNITSYRADRVITMEFMGPESDGGHLDASRCSYASFQLVTKELFHPDTGSNTLTGTGESPNIGVSKGAGQDTKGKSSYDSGIIIAPDEKNLGLLQDYFQDGCMAQYDSIGLPREFLADSAIDVPGVNILQFTRGKSRLIYEYLDGMIKQYWLANKLVATTIIAAVRTAVAMVFIHKLDYFQVNYNNHNTAGVTLNVRMQPLESNWDFKELELGMSSQAINIDNWTFRSLCKNWMGVRVEIQTGTELTAAINTIRNAPYMGWSTLTTLKNTALIVGEVRTAETNTVSRTAYNMNENVRAMNLMQIGTQITV